MKLGIVTNTFFPGDGPVGAVRVAPLTGFPGTWTGTNQTFALTSDEYMVNVGDTVILLPLDTPITRPGTAQSITDFALKVYGPRDGFGPRKV